MREGLVPAAVTHVLRLSTDERTATSLAARLGEMLDADENAVAAFEAPDGSGWLLEVFFSRAPDEDLVREMIALALPGPAGTTAAANASFSSIRQEDWVSAALEGLKPVRAGRFVVHGSHDSADVRPHEIGILIEAALAFGTGHHGTTLGCLRLLADELKKGTPLRVLDVGTGTGVLAIAAARASRRKVAAGDIDPVSVIVAAENARLNGAAAYVRPVVAKGVAHDALVRGAPYDLVFANILAKPLRLLARDLAGVTATRGRLILSGLLIKDVPGVLSAYRGHGFHLKRRIHIEGWASLVLARR